VTTALFAGGLNKLTGLGYRTIDTDYGGFTVEVDSGYGFERLSR